MDNNDTHLETLRRLVCEAAGCEARTPGDFYTLTAFVEGRTREPIGLTTVKRLWQYGGMSSVPRRGTLNLLARSIGYRNYDDFCEHHGDNTPSSDPVLGQGVKVADLLPGEYLQLRWNPGREVVVEYLGNSTFRVVMSEGRRHLPGGIFRPGAPCDASQRDPWRFQLAAVRDRAAWRADLGAPAAGQRGIGSAAGREKKETATAFLTSYDRVPKTGTLFLCH